MAAQIPCVDLPVSFIYANQTKATQKLRVVWCLLAQKKISCQKPNLSG
jgi:hypothetical protein